MSLLQNRSPGWPAFQRMMFKVDFPTVFTLKTIFVLYDCRKIITSMSLELIVYPLFYIYNRNLAQNKNVVIRHYISPGTILMEFSSWKRLNFESRSPYKTRTCPHFKLICKDNLNSDSKRYNRYNNEKRGTHFPFAFEQELRIRISPMM